MKQVRKIIVAAAFAMSFATSAHAQGPGRLTAGIFGGVTSVNGDFKDQVGNGWLAGGLIKMRVYGPLDLRADGSYVDLGAKEFRDSATTLSSNAKIVFGTLNALLNLGEDSAAYPGDDTVSPYLLVGAGMYELDYRLQCTGDCGFELLEKKTHFGLNGGFGATVPIFGIRTFAEGRFHRMSRKAIEGGSRSMLLITAGFKIR